MIDTFLKKAKKMGLKKRKVKTVYVGVYTKEDKSTTFKIIVTK